MTQGVFKFIQYRISMVYLLSYLLLFLPLRYRKWISRVIAAVCFVSTTVLDAHTFLVLKEEAPTFMMTFLQIVLVQATAVVLCRYRDARPLFTAISASTFVLAGNITGTIYIILFNNGWIALTAGMAIHTIVLVFFIRYMRKDYLMELNTIEKGWTRFLILPILIYSSVYSLFVWPSNIYEVPGNGAAAFLILLVMIAANVLLFKLLAQKHIDNHLEKNIEFLDAYAHSMRHEMRAVRHAEEEMTLYRHDMRHAMQLLKNYLDVGDLESARKLLDQKHQEMESMTVHTYCKNMAINGVLASAAAQAEKKGITFTCQAFVQEHLENINEFEFAIVVLNLLENAIHAVEKQDDSAKRWIKARIFPVKNQTVVEIINYFDENCDISPDTGLPISRKGTGHGYGLRSVQAFAEKNEAFFKISTENQQFCVRLMMKE